MPPKANRYRPTALAAVLGVALLVLDQWFKALTPIVWLHDKPDTIAIDSAILMLLVLYSIKPTVRLINPVPLVFVLSGSLSNLADILFKGSVVNYWPLAENTNQGFYTTNIADLIIWVGLIWLILELLVRAIWQRRQLP